MFAAKGLSYDCIPKVSQCSYMRNKSRFNREYIWSCIYCSRSCTVVVAVEMDICRFYTRRHPYSLNPAPPTVQ